MISGERRSMRFSFSVVFRMNSPKALQGKTRAELSPMPEKCFFGGLEALSEPSRHHLESQREEEELVLIDHILWGEAQHQNLTISEED